VKKLVVILIGVFALGFLSSCSDGFLKHPENFVNRVDFDIDIKADGFAKTNYTRFGVKFITSDGKKLCGGRATVHSIPSVEQPASYQVDIVNSALSIRVPKLVKTVDISIAYGPFSYGPYTIEKKDTTIVIPISGGC